MGEDGQADVQADVQATSGPAPPWSSGRSTAIAILQWLLVPVLSFVAFGFFFVGVGLSPDSTAGAVTVRDGVILALYGIVLVTVLLLLVGAPTQMLARRAGRHRLERRAAYVPLSLAAVSALIMIGLAIAGFVFGQVAGV